MWTKENIGKHVFLFLVGGFIYYFLEIALRGYSHYSMIICAGLAFLLSGMMNQVFGFGIPLVIQMIASSLIITTLELITGLIVNVWLGIGVWDYSGMPYHFMGQICLPYSILWIGMGLICILVDDWIRHYLFGEEKATYRLF